jgi:hypothetical protein
MQRRKRGHITRARFSFCWKCAQVVCLEEKEDMLCGVVLLRRKERRTLSVRLPVLVFGKKCNCEEGEK